MTILQAAQNVLVDRAVSIFVDMRDSVDTNDEYRDHFGSMGDLIHKIESYKRFGDMCNAIGDEEFGLLGYCGDDEDLAAFIYDVKKYMEKSNK